MESTPGTDIVAADLFCGVGGLTHGLSSEGIRVVAGFDVDPACSYPYSANNPDAEFHGSDVGLLESAQVSRYLEKGAYSVLAGCAPCQAFSKYTQKSAHGLRDRWRLLDRFGEIATDVEADVVTMENVAELSRHRRFKDFISTLRRSGYSINWTIADCAAYGAPQSRKRLVVLGSRHGPLNLLTPLEFGHASTNVREAIGSLPPLEAGAVDPNDSLHRAASLTPINLQRVKASKPGGTWQDWPVSLRLACHLKETGSTYRSIYGRMAWDRTAPTITTLSHNLGSGRFGHPEQNRALSPREAALLQTFPLSYKFEREGEPLALRTLSRLIGNAVPVLLGRVIGRSVVQHLARRQHV
ncbi:DNA-cytosine methyltransferase (plasmid) [Roseomonas mucosa]|uniref:DNA cytosine methyltransferase n=1 Tax=Roseomonas mucosa TaxID=207340 RepID=UPI0024C56563|nr:DNA cytosine methyltransferase [Roseomonas mucosa]QDD92668.1 DNA-cytosine methyltransferase [Roseomonas mucosa]